MKKKKWYSVLIGLVITMNLFGQIPNSLTPAEKVYGLSKFWQEVNYNFVYLNLVDRKIWDSTYVAFIDKVQKTNNDYDYYRLLQRFCAILKDGHTNIYLPQYLEKKMMKEMFGDYILYLDNIEGKAIVTQINASKKSVIPIGSEIIEVNDLPVATYMNEAVVPYISSSTEHVLKDIATNELLKGFEGDQYKLKIRKPSNEMISITLTHRKSTDTAMYPVIDKKRNLLDFKWLENNVAYLALNSFQHEAIDSLFLTILPELYKAKAMIIDLRKNGGGNGSYGLAILKYLIPDKSVIGAKSLTRNHIATYKAWGEMVNPKDTASNLEYKKAYLSYIGQYYFDFPNSPKNTETDRPKVIVPTVVLTSHNTASAAEDFLIYADKQKHFTTVGGYTFGSTGQPFYFMLPGGSEARVCTKRDTYPDGRPFVGVGIVPDFLVERTVSDYLNGRDPEMQKAIELISDKLKSVKK